MIRLARRLAVLAALSVLSSAPLATRAQGLPSGAEPPWPQVGSVEPASGPAAGGTRVTVKGWNFMPGAAVVIGGVEAQGVEVVDGTTLTVTTPPQAKPGRVTVMVVNPDGRKGTRGWAYRYVAGG